jgi:hypothetical protein
MLFEIFHQKPTETLINFLELNLLDLVDDLINKGIINNNNIDYVYDKIYQILNDFDENMYI